MKNLEQALQSGLLVALDNLNIIVDLKCFHELVDLQTPIPIGNTVSWFIGIQSVRGRFVPITHLCNFLNRLSPQS